ncbi:MAG: alanine racemase [Elusimicrobiales bacterium]|nr:alanine racemase [Elusimicrobiales bacterium]
MLKWIEINTKYISDNIKLIKSKTKSKVMVVVKADAYGHGAVKVSQIAEKLNIDFVGVINVEEGITLRKNKIKIPIMILAPTLPEEIPLILKYNLIPTVDKIDFIKKLSSSKKNKISINIDVDSGLKRWGVEIENLIEFVKKTLSFKNINLLSISTHIAYTPYKNMIDAKEKLERFTKVTNEIKKNNPNLIIHAANSLVFLDFPTYHLDMVRIGNLIYGIYPTDIYLKKENSPIKMGIKRPWNFFAKIISVKEVKKGESFGYANEIVATKNMKIASVQVGYADGLGMFPSENTYTITEGNRMWAIVKGKKAMFVTKPSISHTLLDVSGIDAKVGDIAQLWIRRTAARNIKKIYI